MNRYKKMDKVCAAATALMVLAASLLLLCRDRLLPAAQDPPYAGKIFNTELVHTVDIVVEEDNWKSMLDSAQAEEYIPCAAVIDGEAFKNVGIRPKGNSSLTTVADSDSDRYSFKIEFDHYDKNQNYYGLDKLCLNNAIQDNTYMKDFLCYRMMASQGAGAPLCSYVWITVNGEDWGLYLAAEGIEEAFAQRSYGSGYGQLYKPDSMDMGGGGRGAEFMNKDFQPAQLENRNAAGDGESPRQMGFGGWGGMGGSADVLLQYSTDDPADYPNIFDNAVFSPSESDQARLLSALKAMNQGDIAGSVDMEEVLGYFAVHNFVLNGDSYTGSMIHNYYLYEENGLLSMVAWDYNLAFGGMDGGSASSLVNAPIDSPVASGDIAQRPMVAWIFDDPAYTEAYHQALERFLAEWFESGYFEGLVDGTAALIAPYVERDPTAFCAYNEFTAAVAALKEFCQLRAESVRGQLDGDIPSTSQGQAEDASALVDASGLAIADMGGQNMGGPGGFPGGEGFANREDFPDGFAGGEAPPEGGFPGNGEMPDFPGGGAPGDGEQAEAPNNNNNNNNNADFDTAPPATPEASPEPQPSRQPEGAQGEDASQQEESQEGEAQAGGFLQRPGQMPDGFEPEGGRNFPGGISGEPAGEAAGGGMTWVYLGGSVLLLLAGLVFARFFR